METDLDTLAKELRSLDRHDVRTLLRRGEILTAAQRLCTQDRAFTTFLRTTDQPRRAAYKAIAAWKAFGTVPSSALSRFSRGSIDLLTANVEARNEALQLAANTRVTARIARDLLRKYTAESSAVKLNSQPETKHRVITGDDYSISIRFKNPATTADYMAALMNAVRILREDTPSARHVA